MEYKKSFTSVLTITLLLSSVGARAMDGETKKFLVASGIGVVGAGGVWGFKNMFSKKEDKTSAIWQAIHAGENFNHNDEAVRRFGILVHNMPNHQLKLSQSLKKNEVALEKIEKKQQQLALNQKKNKENIDNQLQLIEILNQQSRKKKRLSLKIPSLKKRNKKENEEKKVDGDELKSVKEVALVALKNKKDILDIKTTLKQIDLKEASTKQTLSSVINNQRKLFASVWGKKYVREEDGTLAARVTELEKIVGVMTGQKESLQVIPKTS